MKRYITDNKHRTDKNLSPIQRIAYEMDVNGPAYRGAEFPDFNETSINVTEFPDKMRPKEYIATALNEDTIAVDYVTQEEFDGYDFDKFSAEVCRCVEELMKLERYEGVLNLQIEATCRDGEECGYGYNEYSLEVDLPPVEVDEDFDE